MPKTNEVALWRSLDEAQRIEGEGLAHLLRRAADALQDAATLREVDSFEQALELAQRATDHLSNANDAYHGREVS